MSEAREASKGAAPSGNRDAARRGLLVICFFAFISLGLPDGLLGVAWPSVRREFFLPIDALGLVMVVGTAGYVLSSFYCGALIRRWGIGGLLSLSCGATAVSLLAVATSPWWSLIVGFAFVLGAGAGAIDAALNTYVAKFHGARAMQWMHACFGVGITLGPLIMIAGLSGTGRWQLGYAIVGGAQLILAAAFFFTRQRWSGIRLETEATPEGAKDAPMRATFRVFNAHLSMLMFLFYVGVELGLGLWAFSFLTEARGVETELAGLITGAYWAMFTAGRIFAGWYAHHLPVRKILHVSVALVAVGLFILMLEGGPLLAVIGFSVAGFAAAPIFPGLVSDTEVRVGWEHHANAIGMQIAAAGVGAALVPALAGVLARRWSLGILPAYMLGALGLLWLCLLVSSPRRRNPPRKRG